MKKKNRKVQFQTTREKGREIWNSQIVENMIWAQTSANWDWKYSRRGGQVRQANETIGGGYKRWEVLGMRGVSEPWRSLSEFHNKSQQAGMGYGLDSRKAGLKGKGGANIKRKHTSSRVLTARFEN